MSNKTFELLQFNETEFKKMETNLNNLIKSNNLTIKFTLNYFTENCVENGAEGAEYCWYFVKANGIETLLNLMEKFKEKNEAV